MVLQSFHTLLKRYAVPQLTSLNYYSLQRNGDWFVAELLQVQKETSVNSSA